MLSEAFIKAATGESEIVARAMYQDWESIPTTFKLWLATNHKPQIKETGHAIWRRLRLIPFNVKISNKRPKIEDYDRKLLATEADGILRWALDGTRKWQADGLTPPTSVTKATARYRREEDQIGRFIAECCDKDAAARSKPMALFTAYSKWCDRGNETSVTQTAFGRTLEDRGYTKVSIKGVTHRKGLKLSKGGKELVGMFQEEE